MEKSGSGLEEVWKLPSGQWRRNAATGGYDLQRDALDRPPASRLEASDLARLTGARQLDGRFFPREFAYDPATGSRLQEAFAEAAAPWVPPYGVPADDVVRGLQRTGQALAVVERPGCDETAEPMVRRALPPAGQYEFFSLPQPGGRHELLAFDPAQGLWSWWQTSTSKWLALEQADGGLLAESSLARGEWGCEVVVDPAGHARIHLPTVHGLACVEIDLLALRYTVRYAGDGVCLGAPLRWREAIRVPQRRPDGESCVLALAVADGRELERTPLADPGPALRFRRAACVHRQAIWIADAGKLVLEGAAGGNALVAGFSAWPVGDVSRTDFGAPYLSADGQLWQSCWSESAGAYVCRRLDGRDAELRPLAAPRMSTGCLNYRLAQRMKRPPWEEPDHGSDANAQTLFLPLLESAFDAAAAGLQIQARDGLQAALDSRDRFRAVLTLLGDRVSERRLFVLDLPAPLESRLFVHERHLWFYHPAYRQLVGWELAA